METSFTFGATPNVELSFSLDTPTKATETQPAAQPAQTPTQAPIAQSFSFVIPETWRPSETSVLRWLSDIPLPVKRNTTPIPAPDPHPVQREKHYLDSDTSMQSHDDDRHRHKRPKLNVFAERRGGLELPRQRPSQAGHGSGHGPGPGPGHGHGRGRGLGLMRHISNAYQRVVTPTPKAADSLDGTTVRATPSRLGTPKTPPDLPRMKFVFVGDPKCGKSSLLLRYYHDTFLQAYVPTKYELFSKTATVDGREVGLEIWDTSGDIKCHQLRLLSYMTWDAVFLCFSLTSQKGFDDAQTKWAEEIRKYCRDAPIIFIGLKTDERSNPSLWSPFYQGARISAGESNLAARAMGAVKYMECSAKTGEGVDRVFEEGIRIVIDERAAEADAARINKDKEHGGRLNRLLCFA